MKRPRLNKLRTLILTTLLTLIPISSFAHTMYWVQMLVNTGNNQFQANVIQDDNHASEQSHIAAQYYGAFQDVFPANSSGNASVPSGWMKDKLNSWQDGDYFPFGFKPIQVGGYGTARNDATSQDSDKAYAVAETLVPELNEALLVLNGGQPYSSTGALQEMASKLASYAPGTYSSTNSNTVAPSKPVQIHESDNPNLQTFTVAYGTWLKNHTISPIDREFGLTADDYLVITDDNNPTNQYEFIWRLPKNYSNQYMFTYNGSQLKTVNNPEFDSHYTNEINFVSWNMLEYQAFYAYEVNGDSADTASKFTKPGPLESAIVSLFSHLFDGLRSMLGLYSTSDLVYNLGTRNPSSFWHGVMSKEWSDRVMEFQWLFQAMAWALITFALIKMLIQRNLATVNPALRVSLIEDIQNLLLTGFILANLYPIVNLLMALNEKIVAVFASSINVANLMPTGNNTDVFAGILIAFAYFAVNLYLNMTYIFRAISIAVLVASGPLFIVTLAFGGRWKGLFSNWLRELVGNIYLQSFHAFVLSFFSVVASSSRGIESLAVAFALIPMTQFFKGLVIGSAGGLAGSLGMSSVTKGTQMAGSAVGGVTGAVGAIRSKVTGGSSSKNSNSSSQNLKSEAGNSSKIPGYNQKSTQEAHDSMLRPDGDTVPSEFNPSSLQEPLGGSASALNGAKNTLNTVKKGLSVGGKVLGAGAHVGQTMAGAGMSLAFGGAEGGQELAHMGTNGVKAGMQGVKQDVKGLGSFAGGAVADVAMNGYHPQKKFLKGLEFNGIADRQKARVDAAYQSGHQRNSELGAFALPNGDIEVHRDGNVMRNEGILNASDYEKMSLITYDTNKLGSSDIKNLEAYQSVFNSGNAKAIDHIRNQGVQNVYKNQSGNLVVAYNDTGKQKLGFRSIATNGDGRIIETKLKDSPIQTRKTFAVAPLPPQSDENQGKNQNRKS